MSECLGGRVCTNPTCPTHGGWFAPETEQDRREIAVERGRIAADEASGLDRTAVDAALRRVVEFLDYDLHKQLECDEETGEDTYAEHVDRFITEYGKVEK
jgi:hypothetical protein